MMRPFSPLYFIKQNKGRCLMMFFLIFMTYASYLGGIYVTNVCSNFNYSIEMLRNFIEVDCNVSDENSEDFLKLKSVVEEDDNLLIISLGVPNMVEYESVMEFSFSNFSYTFDSVQGFKKYCSYMGIDCDFESLGDGSMVMSQMAAANKGLSIGDELESDGLNGHYTLADIIQESGYITYFIDERTYDYYYLVMNVGMSEDDFLEYSNELMEKYDVTIHNSRTMAEMIDVQLKPLNYIYIFILILMSLILAVIINAALVGVYQRRQFEFSVYRALGYSRRRIVGKIAGELICMDVIGLLAGGVVFFLGLYLLNNLYLIKVGKVLFYYHPLALFGLILCNIVVLVPSILTRCRQMLKADICEY